MKSVKNLLVPFIILIALVIGVIIYYVVDNMRTTESSETAAGDVSVRAGPDQRHQHEEGFRGGSAGP